MEISREIHILPLYTGEGSPGIVLSSLHPSHCTDWNRPARILHIRTGSKTFRRQKAARKTLWSDIRKFSRSVLLHAAIIYWNKP